MEEYEDETDFDDSRISSCSKRRGQIISDRAFCYDSDRYPSGDVPREQDVCGDVVIRAMRDAKRGDLQQRVHIAL